jgi:hypothetical protein
LTQNLSADLEAALTFVIERIGEEAERSGTPLDENERYFLWHLPTEPTNLTIHQGYDPESYMPVLRDLSYERLCALAKNARLHDIRTRPDAARDWEFSGAAFQLEHHPMSWLLDWAGMLKLQRPRGDGLLLVGTATLVVLILVFGAITLSVVADRHPDLKGALLIAGGFVYCVIVILLFVAVQRFEKQRLRRTVEKHRSQRTLGRGGPNP